MCGVYGCGMKGGHLENLKGGERVEGWDDSKLASWGSSYMNK